MFNRCQLLINEKLVNIFSRRAAIRHSAYMIRITREQPFEARGDGLDGSDVGG